MNVADKHAQVQRLSGAESLGAYMQEHIWTPLDMTSSTFCLADRPDMTARLPEMAARSPDGNLVKGDAEYFQKMSMDMGSAGMYTSAADFLKLLTALLRNDGMLLSKESVLDLAKPQVTDADYMNNERNAPILGDVWPKGAEVPCNHGLGGLINMEDLPTGRKKGSLMWFGAGMIVWVSGSVL
jgi:CubicO group peptidase (beta-lactamase class C family)